MADEAKIGETLEHAAGATPRVINSPADCPTMVIDGLSGASLSIHMVRLHLVEHIGYEAETLAKHMITLAFDAEQFGKFVDALELIRKQMPMLPADGA